MPYIKNKDKVRAGFHPKTAGELNYYLTVGIQDYLRRKEHNYQTMNDIMGAIEGAKMEFYRRMVVPYENNKIRENGDVYFTDKMTSEEAQNWKYPYEHIDLGGC